MFACAGLFQEGVDISVCLVLINVCTTCFRGVLVYPVYTVSLLYIITVYGQQKRERELTSYISVHLVCIHNLCTVLGVCICVCLCVFV